MKAKFKKFKFMRIKIKAYSDGKYVAFKTQHDKQYYVVPDYIFCSIFQVKKDEL